MVGLSLAMRYFPGLGRFGVRLLGVWAVMSMRNIRIRRGARVIQAIRMGSRYGAGGFNDDELDPLTPS